MTQTVFWVYVNIAPMKTSSFSAAQLLLTLAPDEVKLPHLTLLVIYF